MNSDNNNQASAISSLCIYWAQPWRNQIKLLQWNTLEELEVYYKLASEINPYYLTVPDTQNGDPCLMWITCPRQSQIVIMQESNGVYRILNMEQIGQQTPSQICVTSDSKVVGIFFICSQLQSQHCLSNSN